MTDETAPKRPILTMSICTYQSGDFDVILKMDGEEITFSGHRKLTEEEFDLAERIAPACVWTKYERITPED